MKRNIIKEKDNYQLSIFFMLIASFCFALVPIIIKSLKDIPLMEVVFFRNFVSMLIIPLILFWRKIPIYGNNKNLLLLRGLFGYLGIVGMYYAYTKMPIVDAVAIHRLSPFFVMILSVFLLKENITSKHVYIIFLAFFGALIVIKPGFRVDILPAIIALAASLCVSMSHVILRQLRLTDTFLVIINYFAYISGFLSIFFLILQGNFIFPKYYDLTKLLLIGIISIGAQVGVTLAYNYAPASKISIYLYTQILFATILEYLFLGIFSDFLTLIGASIIVLAGIINFFSTRNYKH
ncbi:Pseudopaline exporter CntI [subsurface metagenome]